MMISRATLASKVVMTAPAEPVSLGSRLEAVPPQLLNDVWPHFERACPGFAGRWEQLPEKSEASLLNLARETLAEWQRWWREGAPATVAQSLQDQHTPAASSAGGSATQPLSVAELCNAMKAVWTDTDGDGRSPENLSAWIAATWHPWHAEEGDAAERATLLANFLGALERALCGFNEREGLLTAVKEQLLAPERTDKKNSKVAQAGAEPSTARREAPQDTFETGASRDKTRQLVQQLAANPETAVATTLGAWQTNARTDAKLVSVLQQHAARLMEQWASRFPEKELQALLQQHQKHLAQYIAAEYIRQAHQQGSMQVRPGAGSHFSITALMPNCHAAVVALMRASGVITAAQAATLESNWSALATSRTEPAGEASPARRNMPAAPGAETRFRLSPASHLRNPEHTPSDAVRDAIAALIHEHPWFAARLADNAEPASSEEKIPPSLLVQATKIATEAQLYHPKDLEKSVERFCAETAAHALSCAQEIDKLLEAGATPSVTAQRRARISQLLGKHIGTKNLGQCFPVLSGSFEAASALVADAGDSVVPTAGVAQRPAAGSTRRRHQPPRPEAPAPQAAPNSPRGRAMPAAQRGAPPPRAHRMPHNQFNGHTALQWLFRGGLAVVAYHAVTSFILAPLVGNADGVSLWPGNWLSCEQQNMLRKQLWGGPGRCLEPDLKCSTILQSINAGQLHPEATTQVGDLSTMHLCVLDRKASHAQLAQLLAAGANINHQDGTQNTPLHMAATLLQQNRMTSLLELGAQIYATQQITWAKQLQTRPGLESRSGTYHVTPIINIITAAAGDDAKKAACINALLPFLHPSPRKDESSSEITAAVSIAISQNLEATIEALLQAAKRLGVRVMGVAEARAAARGGKRPHQASPLSRSQTK